MSHKQNSNNEENIVVENSTLNQEDNTSKELRLSEEKVSSKEQLKKNSVKKIILGLVILALVVGIGVFVYTSQIKSNEASKRFEQSERRDYTQLINNWNKQVQKNTSKRDFLLSRDSNDKMVEQLEKWMENFYIPELTDSLEYNQFLEKNKFGKPTYFDSTMSKDEIRKLLKKTTKEKVMSKIVKKVLMMNDMELWEKLKINF